MYCVARYFCHADAKEIVKNTVQGFKRTSIVVKKAVLVPANDFSHVKWSTYLSPSASELLLELPLWSIDE
jgi:hypothetical protein